MNIQNEEIIHNIIDHSVIKSPNDKNEYYYDILPNGLRYIVISNKDIDKSAVALDVYIGCADDPKEYQGLAHCLEHVIFLGTEKYPNASGFDDFLNLNSGYSNANTSLDHTNFQYEICHEQLEKSIEMFSEFFISPLFQEEYINKELNAIESEFKLDYRKDFFRIYNLFLFEGYKSSSFNTFINGNLDTLQKIEIREKVIEFYNNKYDPKIMSLCVFSNRTIDELKNMVINYFSKIKKNKNFNKTEKTILYDKNNMGYLYKIIPIKNISYIKFIWIINKSYSQYYKSEPYNYVTSVLGHEGKHSLTSYLKQKGYIYDLLASYGDIYEFYSKVDITIRLTDEGYNNINEIIKVVLSYVIYLQKEKLNKDFFDELKKLSEINFFLDEQISPIDLCEELSSSLTVTKIKEKFFIKNKIEEYRPDFIKEFLNSLTMENLNIYILSDKLKDNNNNKENEKIKYNIEKIYGTEYIKEKMDFYSFIININDIDLSFPELNPFLPNNLNMIDLNIENISINDYLIPKKFYDNESIIWYKPNIKYNMPKVYISCEGYISNINMDYTSYIIFSDIFLSLIKKELSEFLYLGDTSDNSFTFSFLLSSIMINIEGYSDSIEKYIIEFFSKFSRMINIQNIEGIYNKIDIIIDKMIQKIKNFSMGDVKAQTETNLSKILKEKSGKNKILFCQNIKKQIENKIIPKEFLSFIKNILKKIKYEWLIEGNISFKDAEKIILNVENEMKKLFVGDNQNKIKEILSINEIRKQRIINIPEDILYRYNFTSNDKENESSTILIYFQIGNFTYNKNNIINKELYEQYIKHKSLLFILHSIFYESFYDELRTQQQIGYDVEVKINNIFCILGLDFYISSSNYNPDEILEKINNFIIEKDINDSNNFTDDDFESYRKSVINDLSQKPLTLEEEFNRDFSSISNRTYNFSLRKDLINYLNNNVTKKDVIDFFNKFIYKRAKRLEIFLYKSKNNNDKKEEKMDIDVNMEEKDEKINYNLKISNEKKVLPSYENKKIEIINDIDCFHRYINYYDDEFY